MGSQGVVDGLSGTIDGLRSFFYLIIKAGIMSVSVNQDLLMRRGDGKPAWLRYCFLNASDMGDLESSLFFYLSHLVRYTNRQWSIIIARLCNELALINNTTSSDLPPTKHTTSGDGVFGTSVIMLAY
jgi:hypothetical protein